MEHAVRARLLLLAPQLLDLGPELGDLIAVGLVLVGQLALVASCFCILASSEGVCFAGLGLQLALQFLGVSLFAGLVLL